MSDDLTTILEKLQQGIEIQIMMAQDLQRTLEDYQNYENERYYHQARKLAQSVYTSSMAIRDALR